MNLKYIQLAELTFPSFDILKVDCDCDIQLAQKM